jgi:hypothetical protein
VLQQFSSPRGGEMLLVSRLTKLQFIDFLFAEFAGNTRVVNQKELEFFREELQNRMSSSYNVILKERKLPLSLLNDHQKVCGLSKFEL